MTESSTKPAIESMPTEILLSILALLPSRSILPLLPVSRRFYSVALRMLHARLTKAAALPDHRLILECYHPSAKISTPYLYCDFLSVDDLPLAGGDTESGLPKPTLADLSHIYSRFRPVVQDENRRPRARYPTAKYQSQTNGDSSGSGTQTQADEPADTTPPTQDVYLDEDELFSQLCTVINVVKLGPKHGLFISHTNVSDGIIRVWRRWLAQQAQAQTQGQAQAVVGTSNNQGDGGDDNILWADPARTVGLRFRVSEKDMPEYQRPVLIDAGEEPPVAYRLELEELVVRANHLLLAMEKSEAQEFTTSGFYFQPRGPVSCPAQYFCWMNQQDQDDNGMQPMLRWVPVEEVQCYW